MTKITIRPQVVYLASTLESAGITGIGIHKGSRIILPREVIVEPPGANPPATGAFAEWLAATGRTPNVLDPSEPDGFGQVATNLEAYCYGGNSEPDITNPGGTHIAIQENLNPLPTGIVHQIVVGDGKAFRPAVEGIDIQPIDIGAGPGAYTRKVPGKYGDETISSRVMKNTHPLTDQQNAILRTEIRYEA